MLISAGPASLKLCPEANCDEFAAINAETASEKKVEVVWGNISRDYMQNFGFAKRVGGPIPFSASTALFA
jgi:hypothetical protein